MESNVEKFEKTLRKSGVINFAEKIGIDYREVYLKDIDKIKNPYKDYKWMVRSHSLNGLFGGEVIHAIPPASKIDEMPWEEWFMLDDELYHHVLYSKENNECDKTVVIENGDKDHPKEVTGGTWYYYKDRNLKPKLLQG